MKSILLGLLAILFSNFAMGQTLYTFNGGGTNGVWTDPNIWTTDPTGSTSINPRIPANGDNIVVTNSFVVYVNSAVASTGLNITVQRGGVLDLTSTASTFTSTLTSLGGQGTLRIAAPYFPTITTNNFDDVNTGTVEYYNWPSGASLIPLAGGQYNNVRFLNSTAVAYTARLDNDLLLNGSLTVTRTDATAFPAGSTYASAAAAAAGAGVSFMFGNAAASRILTVSGNVTIGVGTLMGIATANATHNLNVNGSFVNNGTVNLHNGTTDDSQVAVLTFKGSTDANFVCNGSTDLDILRVDKGIDSQVLLNVTSTVNPQNSFGNLRLNHVGDARLLELVNGVAKLGNNVYLSKIHNGSVVGPGVGTGYYELGSSSTSPTLWVAGGTVINNNALAFVIYGTLRVSGGSLTSVTSDAMVVREDGQVLIEGGTATVNKFRPSSTSSGHRGSFIISGGTFEAVGTFAGTEAVTSFARFAIPYQSQAFRMTGGTIRVANPANCTGLFHIGINSNNAVVTGGVIELQLPNTNTNASILTTAPLWNLLIKKPTLSGGTTSKAILANITSQFTAGATNTAQPITVLNNFTLDATNPTTFDAAGLDVTIQGTLNIGTGCTYLPGANTTTFSGTQNQLLTNNGTIGATASLGTFNNWTVNKAAGTLTLGGSVTTYYTPAGTTLSLVKGVLNDGGKTINVQGNVINSASHTSAGGSGSIVMNGATAQTISGDGTGIFGNLKIFNSALAAGSVAVTLGANITVTSTLTLQGNHIFAIGSYRLSLTNVNTNALQPLNGFNNQRMIQTAGNQSDLGLQKTYGGAQAFTFPVGSGTKYTPATVDLQLATGLSKYGQVSVSPANTRSPFVASATNSLAYYWKVRSTGFGTIPSGAIFETFHMIDTDAAGAIASYVAGRYLPVAWNTTYSGGVTDFGTYSDIAFNGLDQFDGEFTAGLPATFGPITSYYSMRSGNWTDTNLATTPWSTTGFSGPAVATTPGAGNPVFIGSASGGAYHTVNVIANTAKSGSLVIDRGSVLDVSTFTGHNFGALPDSKVGGAGRLRVSTSNNTTTTFPGGDFGSFLQSGGGTVEYYTGTKDITVPVTSETGLALNQYRNLWLNATTGRTITLPNQDLRIYSQLKTGTQGGTGTVLMSNAAAGNLRADSLLNVQAGIFRYPNTTARLVTADTDVKVDASATFDVANSTAVANTLTVGGSLTNNGTLNFKNGTGTVALTFIGSTTKSLTGPTGVQTTLSTLTLNKGTGRAATLNVDVAGTLTTPTNSWLTLTNGTLRYAKASSTLTIHDAASPYLITDNAGLTVDANAATVTVATNNSTAADLQLAGLVQVLQGTLNVGASGNVGNDLEYASAGAPGLKVSGTAKLYVNGQIRRTVSNLDGALRFDQSGGTIDIDGQGASALQSNERGLFEVQGVGSIFRMSGGTMNLHRSNQKNPILTADLYLAPDSTVVTGGTVVLGNPTTATIGSNVTISVNSTVPLYDLRVESGANATNTNTGLLAGVIPLTLKGSLTIGNDFSFFNANGLGLNLNQHLINNNTSASTALNAGGFQPTTTTQTTTFVGGLPTQLLTGTATNLTVFGNLVVNNPQTSGTVQLGGNALVAGTLTLTKGTLDDNGKTLTALGDVLNSATHTSTGTGSIILAGTANQNIGGNGTGRFGNLTLNNSIGATAIANEEITKVLTLTSGVFTIGSNLLWLSNPAAGAVAGTFDATRFIRTNGIVADLGVRKNYPTGALNFTFPVGAAAKYTPVQMNVTANATAGTITVQPIDLAHPSTTDPAAKELSFYWKVSSSGLSGTTLNQQFTYIDNGVGNDVNGTEANYKLGRFLGGQWNPLNGIATSVVSTAANTLTNTGTTFLDGDYTGAEVSEFGAVPTFYSRNATAGLAAGAAWNLASSWTYNADGSDSPLALPTTFPTLANPVVIRTGHLINSNGPGRGAATLQLLGTLDLGTNAANNFNTTSGTGTLRIGSALFPAGNYANFVAANTGTVDYTGAVQLPARDTYNNLSLSGGTSKQLTNLDLTINGTLNVAASTTVDNPTSQAITLTSATSGATVNGTFNLNDGKLTTGASVATGSTGTLNLGAGTVAIGTSLTNGGTVTQGSGAVTVGTSLSNTGTYNATTGTGSIAVGTTFTNSGTYTAGVGNLNVTGDVNNTATGNFTAGTGEVNAGGNFSNTGSYTALINNVMHVNGDYNNLATGFFDAANSNMVLRGSFANSATATFNSGTSLVQFITDVNRFITGNTTFYDLQKLGNSALTLGTSTNVHVADILTIQNSVIYTGANTGNTLYLDNTATQPIVGNSLTAYVAGRLAMALPDAANNIRVFPVGAGQRYRPVTIKPLGASASAIVLVEIINGPAPGANSVGNVDATLQNISVNRYYRIQVLSGTVTQPTIQLSFNTDVEDEKVNVPGNLRVARSTGANGPWSTAGGSGVYSPDAPKGYTTSAATTIDGTSFFVVASTNKVDNPLNGAAPLPVELVQFSATRQGSAVQVAWATASEKNSDYFVVERSANGRVFSEIKRVDAQHSSTSRHDYGTLDTAPLAGTSYYRLRQVDQDGTTAYSNIATVRFDGKAGAPALLAYPNPATSTGFQLATTNLGSNGGTVQVFDNVGRLVLTQTVAPDTAEATIKPVHPLASGMYMATWTTTDGVKLTTKVAVE